jgi:hypothetical protein
VRLVIENAARTGRVGDGKIFVTPLGDVVRIRTRRARPRCGMSALRRVQCSAHCIASYLNITLLLESQALFGRRPAFAPNVRNFGASSCGSSWLVPCSVAPEVPTGPNGGMT